MPAALQPPVRAPAMATLATNAPTRATDPVSISLANAGQTPAALALLPELLQGDTLPPQGVLLIHPQGRPSQLLGAAALRPSPAFGAAPGFGFVLRVLPGWRRQHLGERLMKQLAAQARAWEVARLVAPAVADGSATAAWLAAMGFEPGPAVLHWRSAVAPALAQALALQQALVQHQRVPRGVVVKPLQQVSAAAVAALAASLPRQASGPQAPWPGDLPTALPQALQDDATRGLSLALMTGQRLCGLLLAGVQDGLPRIRQLVVAPDLASGWPEVLLLCAYLRQAQSAGHAQAGWHATPDVLAPQHLARKAQAPCEAVRRTHSLALQPPAHPA